MSAPNPLPLPTHQPHYCGAEDDTLSRPTFNGTRYDNPPNFTGWHKVSIWKALKWSTSRNPPNPPPDADTLLPVLQPDWEKIKNPAKDTIQATWIGHASFLVQMEGLNFLTDPVWSIRCSPLQFIGPKRYRPTPCTMDELPEIHFVVISHNHYDHLDASVVEKLGDGPLWIVPKGHVKWFNSLGVTRVVEFEWWDEVNITETVKIVCLPAQHWSKRTAFDDMCALWSGWGIIGSKQRVYFAGDTGYGPAFAEIGQKFGPFDLGLIPIGAYDPRWMMCPQHVDPEEAVQIHVDIRAKKSIGMHWGTFILTDEPVMEPPQRVAADLKKRGLKDDEFIAIKHGELLSIAAESADSDSSSVLAAALVEDALLPEKRQKKHSSNKKMKLKEKVDESESTTSSISATTDTQSSISPVSSS